MKLICALILWQVLLQVSKEDTVSAETNQIDKQSKEIESKNNETQILKEKVIRLEKELESKNDQLKDSQEIESELQRELGSKNKHIQHFEEIETELRMELESKNRQIQFLEEIESELRRELESKYVPVGKCSMPTVREEISRQHRIMEKLEKNLSEKQKDDMDQLYRKIHSKSENLENCEKKLKSQKSTIDQLKGGVKEFVSQLPEQIPENCIEILSSGPQYIVLSTGYILNVFCNSDIAGPGWTVIQQRINGKVDFYRDWNSYRDGFGDFWDGEFFLGLEKIHRLTAEEPHELYIHMERFDGSSYYARYDEFAIAGEDDQYKLIKLGAFSGSTEDDMMKWNKNMKFTTYDHDNDANDGNCAKIFHGAWWYSRCAFTNLNGRYFSTEVNYGIGIYWEDYISLKQVKMMIRPKVTSK